MGTVEFDFTFFVEVRGDLVGLEGFPVKTRGEKALKGSV